MNFLSYIKNKFRNNNYKKYIPFIILFIFVLLIIFLSSQNATKETDDNIVDEPDVPISEDVLAVEFEQKGDKEDMTQNSNENQDITNSSNSINNNSNQGQNGSHNSENQNNESENSEEMTIESLGTVVKIRKSLDGKLLAILSDSSTIGTSNLLNTIIQKAHAEDTKIAYTLTIINNDGKVVATVAENRVIDMDFCGNDYLCYQIIGSDGGIYRYDIKNKSTDLIVYTYETKSFKNTVLIDTNKYFFIQPNTGKVGFGSIGSTELVILDEKVLDVASNYVKTSAFKYASLSPNRKYVAFYDLSPDSDDKVSVKIYPTTATIKDNLYFETKVIFPPGGFQNESDILNWSKDAKFLTAGFDGTIIDVENKKVIHTDEQSSVAKLSPDNKKFLVHNKETGEILIKELSGNKLSQIKQQVSSIEWFSNELLILTIGKRLYVFNVNKGELRAVTLEKSSYKILELEQESAKAWVSKDGRLLEIRRK